MAGNQEIYEKALRAAEKFSAHGDWTNALKAYRAAVQEFPTDIPALLGLSDAYFKLQQYQSTVRALQHVLKIHPAHGQALEKMAAVFTHLGRADQAAKTYVYAGNLQAKSGQLEAAVQFWDKAIEIDGNQIQARNNLAHALVRLGNTDRAAYELVQLAAAFQSRGDDAKARQYLNAALKIAPDADVALVALDALEGGESIAEALLASTQAADDEQLGWDDHVSTEEESALLAFSALDTEDDDLPGSPREEVVELALGELANVLFEESLPDLNLAVPKAELDMLIGQAIDLHTRGDNAAAIEMFETLIQHGFKRPAVYFMLADLYFKQQKYKETIAYLNRARSHRIFLQGINYTLGECYRFENDLPNALRYYVEVLRLIDLNQSEREGTRELTMVYQHLVENYLEADDPVKLKGLVDALARFLSTKNYAQKILDARSHLGNGSGSSVNAWVEFLEASNPEIILSAMAATTEYIRQNMFMTAIEACYRAIEASPFYLPLHLRLAEVYLRQDVPDDAIRKYLAVADVYAARGQIRRVEDIYQKVLNIAPMDMTVREKLVNLYVDRGDIDAALEQYQLLADSYYQLAQIEKSLEMYEAALELAAQAANPVEWKVTFFRRMADIYIQRVQWGNALRVYEQLVQLAPNDEEGLCSLIDLYFKMNHQSRAVALLQRLETQYARQNRTEAWQAFLQKLVELRPREMILRQKLAAYLAEHGATAEAVIQYDLLGDLQMEAGLRDDAVRTIRKILSLNPADADSYRRLLKKIETDI